MRVSFPNFMQPHNISFKKTGSDDEFVNVPLIWDAQEDEFIKSSSSAVSKSQDLPVAHVPNSADTQKEGSKFSKFKKNAVGIGGAIVAAPSAVTYTVKSYSDAINNSKESIENSIVALGEIKDKAKEIFRKNKPEDEQETELHYTNGEERLADAHTHDAAANPSEDTPDITDNDAVHTTDDNQPDNDSEHDDSDYNDDGYDYDFDDALMG